MDNFNENGQDTPQDSNDVEWYEFFGYDDYHGKRLYRCRYCHTIVRDYAVYLPHCPECDGK